MAVFTGPSTANLNDTVCIFTASGSFTPPFSGTVEVLVVAGGGAGGLIYNTQYSVTAGTTYTVIVGAGGASRTSTENGLNGGNSSFGALTATGGGGGASSSSVSSAGTAGGSGGGGSHSVGAGGAGTSGQGFAGGTPAQGSSGGGGGGAGGIGKSTAGNADGSGGPGLPFTISGSLQYYAGGGGGSRHTNISGGIGGGGAGWNLVGYGDGSPGTPNTGGGGGGTNRPATNTGGGAGGSGIVIVRFLSGLGNPTVTNGNIISANSLIMYYDMINPQNSWRGAPTTNLVNTNWSNWSVDGSGQGSIGTRTITGPFSCRIIDVASNTRQSIAIDSGIAASTVYTFSVRYQRLYGTPRLRFQIQAYNGGTYLSGMSFATTAQLGLVDINGWQTAKITLTTPVNCNRILWFMQDGDDYTTYTHGFELENVQCEQLSIATPFVNGTRSNTQAILDLTGKSTITASSLTYASDGTFSFNRSSSNTLITNLPINATPALSNFTYEVLLNITSLPPASNNGVVLGATYYAGAAIYWRTNGTNFTIKGFIRGSDDYRATSDYTLDLNTTYHVVITNNFSAGTLNLYINGVLFSSVATATQRYNLDLTPGLNIGINQPQVDGGGSETYSYFTGKVDSAKIYNRALSALEVQQNFNATKMRFYGESPQNPATSGFNLKSVRPELPSGYYWIKTTGMPSALRMYVDMTEEGGGYDFYPMQGSGTSIGFTNGVHSGIALGLDLVYPRSKQHWIAMSNFVRNVLGSTGNEYFTTVYSVHRETSAGAGSRGGNYTGDIMRNPASYGTGAPDWRVPDGGRWWLRDTTFGEPNGDYTAYNFLGGYTLPNPYTGQDLQFNDVTGQNYVTGGYYLLSTNSKP
jgi:hypothetical protein